LEKENDRLRGAGGFKRVTENVRALKAQKGAPYVGIQFTLQPENVGVLYETCREAVSLGADWFLINLRWYLSAEQARRYEQVMQREFNITPTSHLGFLASYDLDTEAFLDQCRRILNDEWPIQISSYLVKPEDIHTYVKSPETHPYDGMCCKQWVRMDVLPNGDVTPCIQYPDMVFGNLHDRGVSELWNCQEFARFRRFIRQQSLPVCSKCYPSYLYDAGRRYL
jgi:radical SAM protein with 4Fe4S-binding SPASM domain